jgi:hypothetical protein
VVDDVRGGGWEVVSAKLLHNSIAANDSGWTLSKEHREKSQECSFTSPVFAVDGYVSAYVQFGNSIPAIRVNQNQASQSKVQIRPL